MVAIGYTARTLKSHLNLQREGRRYHGSQIYKATEREKCKERPGEEYGKAECASINEIVPIRMRRLSGFEAHFMRRMSSVIRSSDGTSSISTLPTLAISADAVADVSSVRTNFFGNDEMGGTSYGYGYSSFYRHKARIFCPTISTLSRRINLNYHTTFISSVNKRRVNKVDR